ncbi:hypothetical protein BK123_24890 [Paenibacillus lautus]|uniref:Uncharacterized protein n=1 Tax=Paenibacillus lautus TaxID=1401 RepID=A0A1R1AWK7_PAELA|nr:hypothetical protein BK123_24890 [Paenibacillus lautus]
MHSSYEPLFRLKLKKKLQTRLAALEENSPERASLLNQEARLDDMITMLEWVLFEPSGSYHM